MATVDTTKSTLTPAEIEQISKEVTDFQSKSVQYAASSPTLSAHYWRLYQAAQPSLKRFDRTKRAAEKRETALKRKTARSTGKSTGAKA